MSAILQIASYIDQMEHLVLDQKDNIKTSIAMISEYKEASREFNFEKGLVLGAFIMSETRATEEKVSAALRQTKKTLEPLGLSIEPILSDRIDFFEIDLKKDLSASLEDIQTLLEKRANAIHRLKESVLQFSDDDLKEFYSKDTVDDFKTAWDEGFELL